MSRWYEEVPQTEGLEAKFRTILVTKTSWGPSRWLLMLGFAFLGLTAGVGVFYLSFDFHRPRSFFPHIPTTDVTFTAKPEFLDNGTIGDQAWHSMMPLGAGFFRVPHPRTYGLPKSIGQDGWQEEDESEEYQASVTHQLHCLATLRVITIHGRDNEYLEYNQPHLLHCLDILRQSILCAGDITLLFGVPGRKDDGGSGVFFDGVGSVHQCRDWEYVKELMAEHQFSNYNGSWLVT